MKWIPDDARPFEVGILVAYYILKIKDPKQLAQFMHYQNTQQVYRTLKKYRKIGERYHLNITSKNFYSP